jgi:hypothetical protein
MRQEPPTICAAPAEAAQMSADDVSLPHGRLELRQLGEGLQVVGDELGAGGRNLQAWGGATPRRRAVSGRLSRCCTATGRTCGRGHCRTVAPAVSPASRRGPGSTNCRCPDRTIVTWWARPFQRGQTGTRPPLRGRTCPWVPEVHVPCAQRRRQPIPIHGHPRTECDLPRRLESGQPVGYDFSTKAHTGVPLIDPERSASIPVPDSPCRPATQLGVEGRRGCRRHGRPRATGPAMPAAASPNRRPAWWGL